MFEADCRISYVLYIKNAISKDKEIHYLSAGNRVVVTFNESEQKNTLDDVARRWK
ncbi:MAG: hypothetical protein ACLTOM_11365 [Roseburia sp.]